MSAVTAADAVPLDALLDSAGADEPVFPERQIAALEDQGHLAVNARAGERPPADVELDLVRRVSAAHGGAGRILDGHLNAVERLAVAGPPALRDSELDLVRQGRLRAGVWGADPRPGEGDPARVARAGSALVLRGVKTFCSGAGGLHRALVLARPDVDGDAPIGPPVAVWVDLRGTVEIDEGWYRGGGLRSSVSHRVVFHDTPVLAVLGEPGWLSALPWFARDALRTSATWAGLVDAAAAAAQRELAARPRRGELEHLAAGRIRAEQATVGLWQQRAIAAMDDGDPAQLRVVSLHARAAIAAAATRLLDEAVRACGSHPLATGGDLDRIRRDLDVFLLQHRLDPLLARDGAAALDDGT